MNGQYDESLIRTSCSEPGSVGGRLGRERPEGSPHGADVQYVFEHLDDSHQHMTAADHRISEAMAAYWTNFAKHGDPNGAGLPVWPAFSEAKPVVLYFDATPRTGPVPSEDSLRILDDYFTWRRSPEGAVVKPPERRDER